MGIVTRVTLAARAYTSWQTCNGDSQTSPLELVKACIGDIKTYNHMHTYTYLRLRVDSYYMYPRILSENSISDRKLIDELCDFTVQHKFNNYGLKFNIELLGKSLKTEC